MVGNTAWPTADSLKAILAEYTGKSAYLVPMRYTNGKLLGNNGDFLMDKVFRRILSDIGIHVTDVVTSAEVIVVPPNGALLERYSFPGLLAAHLARLPDLPLIIFPSSAYFPTINPSFMFGSRRSRSLWIVRERHSLEHLKSRWGLELAGSGIDLALDHDVVVSGHRYVGEIIGVTPTSDTLLVSARNDLESSAMRMRSSADVGRARSLNSELARLVARLPYGKWATAAARVARKGRQTTMGGDLIRCVPDEVRYSEAMSGRPVFCDISATQFATFREYRVQIGKAGGVVTNRLHVGLPAAVLGKRVVLIEAGYHKLTGVYEQSLANLPNVTLVNPQP